MTRRGPSRHGVRVTLIAAAAAIGVVGLASCGLANHSAGSGVSLVVTRDFGSHSIGSITEARVPPSQTVTQLLQRRFHVVKRDGGGTVTSIDGVSGGSGSLEWFIYVNGIQGTTRSPVHAGDRIWWDLHDRTATDSTPAVVGSFPEPFVHGIGGKRLPTVLACASDVTSACTRVTQQLRAIGVSVANQTLAGGSGTDSLAVLVGTWSDLNRSLAAALIAQGPRGSGVYARFNGPGTTLTLLNPKGRSVRALGAGAGLIAATSENSASPTLLIAGTDPTGVLAAAKAFTPSRLRNHLALAVQGNASFPVPQP